MRNSRFSVVLCCVLTVLRACTTTAGEACIPEGLLGIDELMSNQQGTGQPAEADRQWIFPSLQFTCTATITAWVFTVEPSIVCPIVELWQNNSVTLTSTDYKRTALLTSSSYAEPEAISGAVYKCTLLTPLTVTAGTVLGFMTSEDSIVQLMNSDTATVGYNRHIAQASVIFNTNQGAEISGLVPMITPLIAPSIGTEPSTTQLPPPTPSRPQPLPTPESTPESTPHPPIQTPARELTGDDSSSSKGSTTPTIIGIVVAIGLLIVIAVAVVVLALIIRRRREISPQPSKTMTQPSKTLTKNGSTLPDTTKSKISRVHSKNNYTFTASHIYEDVGGTTSLECKREEYDYDFINSLSIGPNDEPKNYEVPQSSPSQVSSSRNSSLYEIPGDVYEPSADRLTDSAYDTPVQAQGPVQGSVSAVESGYDTPVDPQTLVRGEREQEEGLYETADSTGVYEEV